MVCTRSPLLPLTLSALVGLFAVGCGGKAPRVPPGMNPNPMNPAVTGLAILGNSAHTIDSVQMTAIGSESDGLALPRDLAFNPDRPGELWVVNLIDHSTVVFIDAGLATQESLWIWGPGGAHFLARPSGIAFGQPGVMATIHEEDELTQGPNGTPEDFMGPTLWSTDLNIFDAGHGGHLDMLHNSPNGTGIAWEKDNTYWVVDGAHNSLTRYEFNDDHGPGGSDHSDGETARFVQGDIGYEPDVPSHAVFDHASGLLYVADTGNNRIVALDTKTGTRGSNISPNYDRIQQYRMNNAVLTVVASGVDIGTVKPSGLEMKDGMLFISDNQNSKIVAIKLTGEVVDYLDTGLPPGCLMGLTFGPMGNLYFVDAGNDRLMKIEPKPVAVP